MQPKNKVLTLALVIILVIGAIILLPSKKAEAPITPEPMAEPVVVTPTSTKAVIGYSIGNRPIEAYTFGTGDTNLLLVGGVHGGYEWNSILLAYEMIDHFKETYSQIPVNVTVHIIPNLNPDGLHIATNLEGRFSATDIVSNDMHTSGVGRFNFNDVDLNRNFDCRWSPESSWRGAKVSGGTEVFSEPEAIALRDYVSGVNPDAAIFWHSKAGNVYGSECGGDVANETLDLMRTYAAASGYGQVPVFDAYVVTGAAEDWLASLEIPAVTVELETRTSIEWEKNLAGTTAVLDMYGK